MNETFLRACVRACVRTERHDTLARDAIKRCCNVADDYIVHYGIGSYDERPLKKPSRRFEPFRNGFDSSVLILPRQAPALSPTVDQN